MNSSLSPADAAELKAFRARAKRNANARARRTPGEGYVSQQARQAAYAPSYTAAGTVSLADLAHVARIHQRVLEAAVIRLVEDQQYSWGQVGTELGISRQAAQQRFGHLVKSRRGKGAQPAHLR